MELDKIYKVDVSGSTRVWYAEVGEGEWEGYWRTHSGVLFGSNVISGWRYAEPKSQPTPFLQALFYAKAAMEKKLKVDYKIELNKVNEERNSIIKPMSANEYAGWQGRCFAQPKLDGMRCLANVDGLWSRTNRRIISTPHIEGKLKKFFQENPNIILDGELYNHNLADNFNLIMSLSRKSKPDFSDLERSEQIIQYWIYDMYDVTNPEMKYFERLLYLQKIMWGENSSSQLVKVPTELIDTEEDLDINFVKLLEFGYEGQMIRLDRMYEQKRSSFLLKRKEFVDEEFELVDIQEGEGSWGGMAKKAICRLSDGRTFGAGISGTQEFNEKLLAEKNKYHSVTVKYHALTPDGIPRFPIAIKFYEELFDGLKEYTAPKKDLFS